MARLPIRRWVVPIVLLIGGLLFIPLFAFGLLSAVHAEQNPVGALCIFLGVFFGRFVATKTSYLLVGTLIGAGLFESGLALRKRLHGVLWGLGVLVFLSIVITPFLYRYEPPVTAAPGRQMMVVTHKEPFDGFIGRVQELIELTPERSKIIGWTVDNILVYQSRSPSQHVHTFVFDPVGNDGPKTMDINGPELASRQIPVFVRDAFWSKDGKESESAGFVDANGWLSPDGQWAATVARHAFGPEDVIVVRRQ
jgi:hypothetical protein